MPSNYAHYRFGVQILPTLPADVRRPIQRFRRLFDMGLHGPDFFFYHSLVSRNDVTRLGSQYHKLSGRDFFTRNCKRLRLSPSEAGLSYLYGVLAHYCLDSVSHGFVHDHTQDGQISHTELESEFDRFLLAQDGRPAFGAPEYMKLSKGECGVIAEFYSPATAGQVQQSIRNMAFASKMLTTSSALGHKATKTFLRFSSESNQGLLLPKEPNPNCAHLNEPLMALYRDALAKYPQYLEQLRDHMTFNAPFETEFTVNFNGG